MKLTITCCDRCKRPVKDKQALVVHTSALYDVNGKKLFDQPAVTPDSRTEIVLCRDCIHHLLEEPVVYRTRGGERKYTDRELHDMYGDPGPGPWEPTEENGGRGGPGDR